MFIKIQALKIIFVTSVCNLCLASIKNDNKNRYLFIYKNVANCKRNEYYDLDFFNCVPCASDYNLVPSDDGTSCKCHSDWETLVLYDATLRRPICNKKSENRTVAMATTCETKFVQQKFPQKDIQIVLASTKPAPQNLSLSSCWCDRKSNVFYERFCIINILLKDYHSYDSFNSIQQQHQGLDDSNIYSELKFVAFFCRSLHNLTACNHYANLCVMSFFNLDKNSPCGLFYISQALDAPASVYGGDDLTEIRPFLFFRKGKETVQELQTTIDFEYRLDEGHENSHLNFVATFYELKGKLFSIRSLEPNDVNLCHRNLINDYQRFRFAKNFLSICKLSLGGLVSLASDQQESNLFINVFLNYTKDNVIYFKPVPVLIRNVFDGNEATSQSSWQLVNRFRFFNMMRKPSAWMWYLTRNEGADTSQLKLLQSLRYISSFEIRVTINDDNKILTPLIVLNYKTVEILPNSSLRDEHKFEFRVSFNRKYSLDFYFQIVFPLLIAIGFAFAMLRAHNFKTRQNKEYYDVKALIEFFLDLLSNLANAMFGLQCLICLYVLLVTLFQSVVKILPPVKEYEYLQVLVWMSCLFKGIYLLVKLYRIANIDVFFIDWERPKGFDAHFTLRNVLETPSVCSSSRSASISDAVSAWRNYFVANEWIEISTKRKTSIFLQSLTVVLTLNVLEHLCPEEIFSDKTLTLAISILAYVTLYVFQISFIHLIEYRCFGNPLQKFTDICSTANISVFVLLNNCYGFYIHGRSPHGFCDTDMSSMLIQLQRESQNICSKRGLLTGSDHQTFTILAPTNLRIYYDKSLQDLRSRRSPPSQSGHFEENLSKQKKGLEFSLEKTAAAYSCLNRFFCAFIDHAIKDLDYIVKDWSIVEALFNCEFDAYLTENKGTFYIDNGHSFDKVLLYGNNVLQLIFEIILFSTILTTTDCKITAAFLTCVVYKIVQALFKYRVKSNVSSKTLIDKRFLI